VSLAIPGMPEGVSAIRFGIASADEFELTMAGDNPQIEKGVREGSISQLIVKPAEGYEFVYDIRRHTFRPVKKLAEPVTINAAVKFTVTNQIELDAIHDRLDRLKEMPGFQEMTGV
jgi:hypothetical protein